MVLMAEPALAAPPACALDRQSAKQSRRFRFV
jgi:hypothetical protein